MNDLDRPQATVLLIDDEPDVLAGLMKILTAAGYECHSAVDDRSARRIADRLAIDVVISDINLGGQSGLTLCEELKRLPRLKDVPVIFLSGAQIPDVIRRSRAAGGVYYLRKPFDPEVLLELIDRALWMPHLAANRFSFA